MGTNAPKNVNVTASENLLPEAGRGAGFRGFRRKALGLAIASGVVLAGQIPAQALPLPFQLPEGNDRVASTDYSQSPIVQKIGDGLVDVMSNGGEKTAPYAPTAGAIRNTFGNVGPHPVAVTREPLTCDGLVYTVYNQVLRELHGLNQTTDCYDVFPETLTGNPAGAQLIYPADIGSMESAPLMILSPGIGTEPGMYDRQARLYASHGYVVAMGYNFTNWFGPQMVLAAATAAGANTDEDSALHNKIDFSRTLLVGHSAGGGSAMFLNNSMDPVFNKLGYNMVTRGVVALNPGPSDFGKLSKPTNIPLLVAVAEHEDIVPKGGDRIGYARATGPAWLAMVNGSYHGTYLDLADKNAYGSLVLSFSEYLLERTPRAVSVYEGDNFSLATDAELSGVERKGI